MARTAPKKVSPQRAATKTTREPIKKYEKWPAAKQLLEQAHASRNLAETLRQNMLTTDPKCPLRLPTVRGNVYAIQEALDRAVKAYAIEGPFPNTRFPSVVRVMGTCHLGWGHRVAMPARNLIRAISGLFIYCDREPLTNDSYFFGPNESPQKAKNGTGRKRQNDGLPIEWLDAVMYLAGTLESELSVKSAKPKSSGRANSYNDDWLQTEPPPSDWNQECLVGTQKNLIAALGIKDEDTFHNYCRDGDKYWVIREGQTKFVLYCRLKGRFETAKKQWEALGFGTV